MVGFFPLIQYLIKLAINLIQYLIKLAINSITKIIAIILAICEKVPASPLKPKKEARIASSKKVII
jgi:hypothetical protein